MKRARELLVLCGVALAAAGSASAQFLETFDDLEIRTDPAGIDGWSFFTGEGQTTMELVATGEGHASIVVDATRDHRNVWWALIKHRVSQPLDLEKLVRPGWELRVEARIRSSHAPRRVNLHVNTQRTTDFHSHLMEFEIDTAGEWHTISMTTRGFLVELGDSIFAQMALMDWGLNTYRVDVDYFKVDVVAVESVPPDLGEPLPYHPPIPALQSFGHRMAAIEGASIDISRRGGDFEERSALPVAKDPLGLAVDESRWIVLRWDMSPFRGRLVSESGLLELTTQSMSREGESPGMPGVVRVVEILGGDPDWRRDRVTFESLVQGEALDDVFNPQMIIDWPVAEGVGAKTWFTVSRPVLQRLIDGESHGIAIRPLGLINVSFESAGEDAPRLLLNLHE